MKVERATEMGKEDAMQSLLNAVRALVTCAHPDDQVQTFSVERVDALDGACARAFLLDRCHQCGSVRMRGDRWFATLGAVDVARELVAFMSRRRDGRDDTVEAGNAP